MPMLTDAEMADHHVTYDNTTNGPLVIYAAYVTTEDKHPDMLAFKDCEHRTITLVKRDRVVAVERIVPVMMCARIPGEVRTIDPAKYAATIQPTGSDTGTVTGASVGSAGYSISATN